MSEPKKKCFKCGRRKPLRLFYKHPDMADGHLGKCITCTKADVAARAEAKREEIAEYERRRARDPHRKAKVREYQRLHAARHPGKRKARRDLGNALRSGKIQRQPCAHCGTTEKVQAHHKDYRRPLDVVWACFRCHREHEHGQRTTK